MATPLHSRLLSDLRDLIVALNLTGSAGVVGDVGQSVYVGARGAKQRAVRLLPGVLLTPEGQAEEEAEGGFEADEVIYPVLVCICDGPATNTEAAQATYLGWRHSIAQALRGLVAHPLLADCPELVDVRLRNNPAIPPGLPEKDSVVSAFVALCRTTEDRVRNA